MTTATTNKEPIFLVSTDNPAVLINVAAGAVAQQIFTAGLDGGAITELAATNADTVNAVVVQLHINNGTTSFLIGEVLVPVSAGTDGGITTPRNLLDPLFIPILDADGSLILEASHILEVTAKIGVQQDMFIVGVGGNY